MKREIDVHSNNGDNHSPCVEAMAGWISCAEKASDLLYRLSRLGFLSKMKSSVWSESAEVNKLGGKRITRTRDVISRFVWG